MSIQSIANQFVCDVPVYEPGRPIEEVARELGLNPKSIIKLASNENPLGPSPKAVVAMRKALATAHLYPDGGGFYLRQALAKKFSCKIDNIILGTGSNEIIEFLYHAFVGPGDEVVAGDKAFVIYSIMARMFQGKCVEVPFNGHTHDLRAMLAAITPKTKLVFVANPNNPSGTRVSNAELEKFIRALPQHVMAVLDEAYIEFLDDPPPSIEWALKRNVIVLRTFSKIVGLAGLRIGYGVAQKECIDLLQRVRQPFNTNAVAQAGALAALGDAAHTRRTKSVTRRGLAYLCKEFDRLKLEYVPSWANFVLVNVGDGDKIFQGLQRRGVIVRPMRGYKMPQWVRVTVGTMEENRRFIGALKQELRAI
ncbi:MAG TPA: histidinol-phosphate transaminase [Verrucomicrobiae bacterium]|nr:histidinol-phosphate transaminase [Verrucomicrobiae bacterium]